MMPVSTELVMRILVCGAQKPFMRGGAEMHMENLVAALRAAGHDAELVRLPVAWEKGRIFDAALAWRLVPLDADLVVATNFPSYFAAHPNKVVWLFHQHRGAYDAADSGWSDIGIDDVSLETQRLLSDWDSHALEEATRLFTTSGAVADRLLRFNGLTAEPLYHPPPLHDRLVPGPFGDYVLAPMRLERNKRPEPLVRALANTPPQVRLVMTGPGSLLDVVRSTAAELGVADRLCVTGFLDDAALIEHFAGALAVVYAPFDEDYGYVTLQAFLAGKPVITAADSGGVLEWVEDGVTGLVTDGSPQGIAAAIARLHSDRELARRLGEAGRRRAAGLSWPRVVAALLGQRITAAPPS
jgi:glycosyltransferase involved in cell wall biosynthesis